MNCPGVDVHLPEPAALVPRPAAALQRVRPAPPQRAVRHAVAASRGSASSSRTTPTSTSGRTSWPTRSRRCSARSARRTAGSGWSRASPSRRSPDKALGDPALWERPGQLIKEALDRSGGDYVVKPKDGTFYAPKIDIYIDDALGREWQMATIQVDLVMLPERFDLTYIDEDRPAAAPDRHPSRHLRLAGALHRHPRRALRGGVPALAGAGPGRRHPDRRPPHRGGRGAGRRPARARPARRGGRLVEPDAEQDPPGPGAEGAVHGRPRRSRDRGPDRRRRGPAPASSRSRRPGRRSPTAWRPRRSRSVAGPEPCRSSGLARAPYGAGPGPCRLRNLRAILPPPAVGRAFPAPVELPRRRRSEPSAETCASTR